MSGEGYMDKIKIGKREYTEEELERNHLEAVRRGQENMENSPKAQKANFDRKNKRLMIDLQSGVTFLIPTNLIQIFQNASDDDIDDIEIVLNGLYLRWNRLDEDLSVSGLIKGIFGTSKWMSELNSKASANNKPQQKKVA